MRHGRRWSPGGGAGGAGAAGSAAAAGGAAAAAAAAGDVSILFVCKTIESSSNVVASPARCLYPGWYVVATRVRHS